MGNVYEFPAAEVMPCSATVAELRRDEIGLGPDDYDPRHEAYEACADDSDVMRQELGDEFSDCWAELHQLIQAPIPKGDSMVERSGRLAEIQCLFERWLDRAATLRAANREWIERDPWGQE